MKIELKKKAISLRKKGLSYNDIVKEVAVSKGTLTIWLRDVSLTEEQRSKLSNRCRSQRGGNNGNQKAWEKKRRELREGYNPPLHDPEFMLGLGLYLGEGSKYNTSLTRLTNCDVLLLKIFVRWIRRFFACDFDGFSVYVHHYYPRRDDEIKKWWSDQLGIPLSDFNKSGHHVSKISLGRRGHTLLYGTVQVTIRGKGRWKVRQKIQKAIDSYGTIN